MSMNADHSLTRQTRESQGGLQGFTDRCTLLPVPEDFPFPNSTLPVLFYPRVFPDDHALVRGFEERFIRNGWQGVWVNGVYNFDHFHACSHEVLGCVAGWARLRLGGPSGRTVLFGAGDAVLLPAGVGHRHIEGSPRFSVVGAYPQGQSPDMERGDARRFQRLKERSAKTPFPQTDPVFGAEGPATLVWCDTG